MCGVVPVADEVGAVCPDAAFGEAIIDVVLANVLAWRVGLAGVAGDAVTAEAEVGSAVQVWVRHVGQRSGTTASEAATPVVAGALMAT